MSAYRNTDDRESAGQRRDRNHKALPEMRGRDRPSGRWGISEGGCQLHRYRTLELFSGAGGGILAGLLLDHVCIGAVEIDPYCQQVLSARQSDGSLPWFPIFDDIKAFDGRRYRGLADIVSGGFP